MWNIGKEMGFTLLKEEEVVLNRLHSLENRDNKSLISMNIKGLGGSTKRKYLSDLIRSEEVGLLTEDKVL